MSTIAPTMLVVSTSHNINDITQHLVCYCLVEDATFETADDSI